jgi:hypothetical protein
MYNKDYTGIGLWMITTIAASEIMVVILDNIIDLQTVAHLGYGK